MVFNTIMSFKNSEIRWALILGTCLVRLGGGLISLPGLFLDGIFIYLLGFLALLVCFHLHRVSHDSAPLPMVWSLYTMKNYCDFYSSSMFHE